MGAVRRTIEGGWRAATVQDCMFRLFCDYSSSVVREDRLRTYKGGNVLALAAAPSGTLPVLFNASSGGQHISIPLCLHSFYPYSTI